jgi:outer membrane protein TolC
MAAVAEKAQTRLVLSSSVVTVYAELAHLYTVRETLNDTLTIRTSTLALFQQRHDAGLEDLSSLQQVETRQLNAKANLVAIDEAIAIKKHALAALIGDGPDRALAITAPKATLLAHEDLPPNIALDLIGRRPDIVAARLRAEAAAEKIKQKKPVFTRALIWLPLPDSSHWVLTTLPEVAQQLAALARQYRCPYLIRNSYRVI